jgi:hypothetical protein
LHHIRRKLTAATRICAYATGSPLRVSTSLQLNPIARFSRNDHKEAPFQDHLPMSLVKSKQRVADHGEVFTPPWMVEAMLDLVKDESERIDSRFLEPACGSGNFLVQVLRRKLAAVERKFAKSDFDRRHYALLAVMCIYGIELLPDNIAECRANLLEILAVHLSLEQSDDLYRAASSVLSQNLVHGDALAMRTVDGQPITFAEWGYLGKGKFQRRDFRLDVLTGSSAFSAEDSLFADLGKHEIFTPVRTYAPLTISELASAALVASRGEAA